MSDSTTIPDEGIEPDTSKYITKEEMDVIMAVIQKHPREKISVWKEKLQHLENVTYLKIDIARTALNHKL